MITTGPAAEHALLQKVASFTRIPKDELKREHLLSPHTQEIVPLYSFPAIQEKFRGNFDPLFYSVTVGGKGALNLAQLIDPAKWVKSTLREAYFQGKLFISRPNLYGRYCLTTHLVGMVWATTHEPREYATCDGFIGGFIVRDPVEGGVFVTRPIKSYLQENLGTPGSD